MRTFSFLFTLAWALATGSAATAEIQTDMQAITRFCLHYVETGQRTDVLLRAGFAQKGRKFKKTYNAGVVGGTRPVLSVESRTSRAGYSCSANVGIISRADGPALIGTAAQTARQLGYTETVAVTSKGRRVRAFVRNGIPIQFGGSSKNRYNTYSAFIFFERLN